MVTALAGVLFLLPACASNADSRGLSMYTNGWLNWTAVQRSLLCDARESRPGDLRDFLVRRTAGTVSKPEQQRLEEELYAVLAAECPRAATS